MTAAVDLTSTEMGEQVECKTWLHHFMGREDELENGQRRLHNEFSFGWSQSVHKAQGSQYSNVLLFDESKAFGKDAPRHLYTGVTRASEKLTVVQ